MRHVFSATILCLAACVWTALPVQAFSGDAVLLAYAEHSGETSASKEYLVEKTARGYRIQWFDRNVKRTIVSDRNLATTAEEYADPATGDALTFRRLGDALRLTGILDGKPVDREFEVDEVWFGSVLLLKDFALSDEKKIEFHMTRPEEQRVTKLVALREGVEQVMAGGRTYQAVKIRSAAQGLQDMFWKSCLWFRTSDGLLVKTEENRGTPGTATVRTELMSERVLAEPATVAALR